MGLGGKSKNKKGVAIQVEYVVQVQEIRPWPPSESLTSVESVLLQWENGEQNSGFLTANVEEDSIGFNKSFTLFLKLRQGKKDPDKFKKNYLEFFLYESPKEMADKGQLLGTVVINFADYGIIQQTLTISSPINCKKSSKGMAQPSLFVKIQPVYKDAANSSPYVRISIDTDGPESIADMEDDDSEIAGFTDDDGSSHSSLTFANPVFEAAWGSPARNEKSEQEESLKEITGRDLREFAVQSLNARPEAFQQPYGSLPRLASMSTSSDIGKPLKNQIFTKFPRRSMTLVQESNSTPLIGSNLGTNVQSNHHLNSFEKEKMIHDFHEEVANGNEIKEYQSYGQDEQTQQGSNKIKRQSTMKSIKSISKVLGGVQLNNGRLKHVKSVQIKDSSNVIGLIGGARNNEKVEKEHIAENASANAKNAAIAEKKVPKNEVSGGTRESESRIEMLEEELREAAAIEFGLYSVAAEHGSSMNKLHAPARRLARLYFHACTTKSPAKQANAAISTASGLIVVIKACGNDITRLTFWLSNLIMFRAIVSQATVEKPYSDGGINDSNGGKDRPASDKRRSRKRDHLSKLEKKNWMEESDNWEDKETFITALEKIEAWIFSRIAKSVWWQILTPHMQPLSAAKPSSKNKGSRSKKSSSSKKTSTSRPQLGDQEQSKFSVKLWKKAFKDACKRLCPVRAGGHECGCLPVLAKLVMEQLVSKLDVAMFNAILHEAGEGMEIDPISDPIGDPTVLPIPAGKSSFGAGAQLKNAIRTWSRCLSDLFGMEDNDLPEANIFLDGNTPKTFKAFRLLNALSDLMMLPFGMLVDTSTRKEVCPTFGPILVKRVLSNFVPDEFSPKPIPKNVLSALDSEDPMTASDKCLNSFPCTTSPMLYSPPPPASLMDFMSEVGAPQKGKASTVKKSYMSDDELNELDSPLTSIVIDNYHNSRNSAKSSWTPNERSGRNVVRYQLLREAWKEDEN